MRENIYIYQVEEAPWFDAKRNKVLLVSSADLPCWYRRISMWKERGETHKHVILFGASELLDNQQRASRDDAKRNIFFLMLNAGHPVCRSPIPFNQIVVDKRYWQKYLSIVGSSLFKIHMIWKFWHSDVKYVVKISLWFAW